MADLSLDNLGKPPKAKRLGVPETTTALGQTAGGANPDQAKMAGTADQVKGAMQHNLTPAPTLASEKKSTGFAFSDALRTARPDAIQQSVNIEEDKAKLEREMLLGKAKADVKDMVKASTEGTTMTSGLQTVEGTAVQADEKAIQTAMEKAGIKVQGAVSLKTISELDPASQQSVLDNLATDYPELHDSIAEGLGKDKVVVKNLLNSFFGGKKEEELTAEYEQMAKDLGVSDAKTMMNMNSKDFIAAMEKSIAADTKQVRELNSTLSNPSASPAERLAAQAELVRMGALGTRTLQEEVAELGKNFNKIDDITVGTKTFSSLADLVKDPELEAIMLRALDKDDAKADDRARAVKQLTDLGMMTADGTGIFDKYSKALNDKLAVDKTKLESVIASQKEAAELLEIQPGLTLNPQVAASVFGSTGFASITNNSMADFLKTVKTGLNGSQQTVLINTINELAQLGHADLIKAVTTNMPADSIIAAIPNLQYILAGEKTENALESMTAPTYVNLAQFAQQGLISAEDLAMAETAGVPPEDILASLKQNNKAVEEWGNLPADIKPFALDVGGFKPSKYEIDINKVNSAINNITIDNIDSLDTIVANPNMPKGQKEVAKLRKAGLQSDYSNGKVAEVAANNIYTMPETFNSPEDYETNANAYNNVLAAQIKQLTEATTSTNPDINKINQKIIMDRIAQLEGAKISQQAIQEKKAALTPAAIEAEKQRQATKTELLRKALTPVTALPETPLEALTGATKGAQEAIKAGGEVTKQYAQEVGAAAKPILSKINKKLKAKW
jgi:molybdopterin converting factor small subunit